MDKKIINCWFCKENPATSKYCFSYSMPNPKNTEKLNSHDNSDDLIKDIEIPQCQSCRSIRRIKQAIMGSYTLFALLLFAIATLLNINFVFSYFLSGIVLLVVVAVGVLLYELLEKKYKTKNVLHFQKIIDLRPKGWKEGYDKITNDFLSYFGKNERL